MTRAQIDILLKDQDIWLESSPDYSHFIKASFIDYENNETFVVSDELYGIIDRIFKDQLTFSRDFDHETFKTVLTNNLHFISPAKEQRLLFYHQQLTKQNNQLSEILSGNFYNTIQQLISSTFHLLFNENGMNWIECIKFKILKGEKLATFNFGKLGEPRSPNFHFISEYFQTEAMMQIYKIAAISENINFLKNEIVQINISNKTIEIDTANEKKITGIHRKNAVAYILKQWANDTKYPQLTRQEAKVMDISFYGALDDLDYFTEKIKGLVRKKPYRKICLKDLKAVRELNLLSGNIVALEILEREIDKREVK